MLIPPPETLLTPKSNILENTLLAIQPQPTTVIK